MFVIQIPSVVWHLNLFQLKMKRTPAAADEEDEDSSNEFDKINDISEVRINQTREQS